MFQASKDDVNDYLEEKTLIVMVQTIEKISMSKNSHINKLLILTSMLMESTAFHSWDRMRLLLPPVRS